jgi:hypothetical protein
MIVAAYYLKLKKKYEINWDPIIIPYVVVEKITIDIG